jgi:glycosyltransferase involved in cell wall biosynthesis
MPPLEVLYHGPDPEVFLHHWSADGIRAELGIPEDSYVVGSVANLKAHKGYDHLLRAADEVRRQLPNVRFVLIGQGPLERELRLLASKLDLDGAVMFTGYREDAVRVASVFDVFVLSSIHEGLSIALIEAMALGKPAIVTDVGGLPEVVEDGRQGFVVPPADPRALSNRIVQVLRDENLRRQFGIEAQKRAQAFQIGNAVRRIEEVYEELLS